MRSDNVKKGMQQAPHRSLFNALGFTKEEMDKPMIGIVSSYNEIVPGHMNLDKIVEAVKLGVAMAGGVPVVFPAIAVCDGIAMGHVGMKYSLVTRDLIADSTECMAMAHQFDGLVMVPNCDKNVPGLLMAAARINIPTVFEMCIRDRDGSVVRRPLENITVSSYHVVYRDNEEIVEIPKTFDEFLEDYPESNAHGDVDAYGIWARHIDNLVLEDINVVPRSCNTRKAICLYDVNNKN